MSILGVAIWLIYVRKIGGKAGFFFSFAFIIDCGYVICQLNYILADNFEQIRFWGLTGFVCLISSCFFLFLGGEYSTSDQPISWRIMIVGGLLGLISGASILSLVPEYSYSLLYVTDLGEQGWVWGASPIFLVFLLAFFIGSMSLFIRFCAIFYHTEIRSPFKVPSRTLTISLAIGLPTINCLCISRIFYPNLDIDVSIIQLVPSLAILIVIITTIIIQPRVIYLQPHKPIALFLVDINGGIHFTYEFNSGNVMGSVELFAPVITAINSIVQQSLKLDQSEWIQQFSTAKHTFLLELNSKIGIIGMLLVPKPTQIVRIALSKFMSNLGSIWKVIYEHEILSSDHKDVNRLLTDAFPFAIPGRKNK